MSAKVLENALLIALYCCGNQSLRSLLGIEQWHILIYGHLYVRHVRQINDMYLTVVITHFV